MLREKAILILRSQALQLRDSLMQLFIFILSQLIKLRSSTYLTKSLPNRQCCLIASLQKDYLQINAFLGGDDRVERNLKTL